MLNLWFNSEMRNKVLEGEFAIHCKTPEERYCFGCDMQNLDVSVDPDFIRDNCFDDYYFMMIDGALCCIANTNPEIYLHKTPIITYEQLFREYETFLPSNVNIVPIPEDVLLALYT